MKDILSYSLHISNGNSRIKNNQDLLKVMKHNQRKYKQIKKNNYNQENIYTLVGSDNLVEDVKKLYESEFIDSINEYNKKQKRSDRLITDYYETISNDKQKDLATEIIIQVGNKQFYEENKFDNKHEEFIKLYRNEIDKLQTLVPEFKIANATLHMDESSPHLHIIGLPITDNNKRGLKKQISKTKVFTQERLEILQKEMRVDIEDKINEIYQNVDIKIKEKEKGRNHDFTVTEYKKIKEKIYKSAVDYVEHLQETFVNKYEQQLNNIKLEEKDIINKKKELLKDIKVTNEEIKEYKIKELEKHKPTNSEIINFKNKVLEENKPNIFEIQDFKRNYLRDNISISNEEINARKRELKEEIKLTNEEINVRKRELKDGIKLTDLEIQTIKNEKIKEYDLSTEDIQKIRKEYEEMIEKNVKEEYYNTTEIKKEELIDSIYIFENILDMYIKEEEPDLHNTYYNLKNKIVDNEEISNKTPLFKLTKIFSICSKLINKFMTRVFNKVEDMYYTR